MMVNIKAENCFACGGSLELVTETHTFNGGPGFNKVTVESEALKCKNCGEVLYNEKQARRVFELIREKREPICQTKN